jgi:adenylate cyclase
MTTTLQSEISVSIVQAALAGTSEQAMLTAICERLNAAGLAIMRGAMGSSLLHPTLGARGVRWNRGKGGTEESFPRTAATVVNENWLRSPFFVLAESGKDRLRRRLDATYQRGEFPLLDDFQDQGATDYIAFELPIGRTVRMGDIDGLTSSWTTDAAGGFTDAQIELLAAIVPPLALAHLQRITDRTARTLLKTYLGRDAAERVLAGNIVRGQAEPIRAVVWYSDLIGFTRISEAEGAAGAFAMLNDYAEVQVEAIESHGGHVLKFIGDGILAIFPGDITADACARALDAATDQCRRIAALNERRAAAGAPVTETHLALHMGELLYGNVGSPRRLDFTVLGPAVNEASRIETLCGSLDQAVIVSWSFAEAAGTARSRLVSLGRYAMKGVARPQELFIPDPG